MTTRSLLVLWDIDHTLIDTGGVGRDAYAAAFREATGVALAEDWRFDGRTELAAAIDALTEHGLPAETKQIERLCESIIAVHAAMADQFARHGQVLPGIQRALATLAELGYVRQSVLTGNLREVAAIKLKALGLDEAVDLRIGAYGSDAVERSALAPFAFQRAARLLGLEIDGRNTAIIGDTPRDIAAAHAVGALAVGVATGHHSTADLKAVCADLVFADLSDMAAVLDGLTAYAGADRDGADAGADAVPTAARAPARAPHRQASARP